ncbi:unnamed protein product, partial [Caretta caretta]
REGDYSSCKWSIPEITAAGPCSQSSGRVGLLTSVSRTSTPCTSEYCPV